LDRQIFALDRQTARFDFAHIHQIFSKFLFGGIVRYQGVAIEKAWKIGAFQKGAPEAAAKE
jgi:hypothetical protein